VDLSVIAAIAKWPNVPAVFGWLSLTARGKWRLRGEPIRNAAICAFIGRNYASDERGRWFFQNGPQRVYVELEATPWIWRLDPERADDGIVTHTGLPVRRLEGAWFDEAGRCYLSTELGFGLVESGSVERIHEGLRAADGQVPTDEAVATWLDGGRVPLRMSGAAIGLDGDVEAGRLRAEALPQRFAFICTPQPD